MKPPTPASPALLPLSTLYPFLTEFLRSLSFKYLVPSSKLSIIMLSLASSLPSNAIDVVSKLFFLPPCPSAIVLVSEFFLFYSCSVGALGFFRLSAPRGKDEVFYVKIIEIVFSSLICVIPLYLLLHIFESSPKVSIRFLLKPK